jgi:small ligand-binding sensory domain FIST
MTFMQFLIIMEACTEAITQLTVIISTLRSGTTSMIAQFLTLMKVMLSHPALTYCSTDAVILNLQ